MFDPILVEARNPGPMTGRGNNTYLLAGGGRAALVDAGPGTPQHLGAVAQALAAAGAALRQVLVTHAHADHAAGAPALAQAHPAASFLKQPWPEEDAKYPVSWRPVADGERVEAGDETLVALHTPGHSPDHVAFWHEPTATLFTGDLVVAGSSVMIHASRGGNLGEYLASLERLRALTPVRLLPAHGAPVDDPEALLSAYIEHRMMRERQVIAALRSGLATVPAIAESIYDGLDPALVPAARENVRAHLEKLRRDGRAACDDRTHTWTES